MASNPNLTHGLNSKPAIGDTLNPNYNYMGIPADLDIENTFNGVKFVLMGGSAERAKEMAYRISLKFGISTTKVFCLSDNKNIILENTIYRYIAPHTQHYLREIRLVAYKQFLTSYKSITISSIASTFGVTRDFIDRDLSHYISSQQLHCKIDKVGGIIEINRLDTRNAQYQTVIQQGDLLLNKIQKLSRVIAF